MDLTSLELEIWIQKKHDNSSCFSQCASVCHEDMALDDCLIHFCWCEMVFIGDGLCSRRFYWVESLFRERIVHNEPAHAVRIVDAVIVSVVYPIFGKFLIYFRKQTGQHLLLAWVQVAQVGSLV